MTEKEGGKLGSMLIRARSSAFRRIYFSFGSANRDGNFHHSRDWTGGIFSNVVIFFFFRNITLGGNK